MKKNHFGRIINIQKINKNVYSITFAASTIKNIAPGEYISILCGELTLRRPFSIASFKDNIITVLFKKKGTGTEYLANLNIGDKIEFSAPLGNHFTIEKKKTLLLGAGIGVAPLFYLEKKLKEIKAETYFSAGFLTKEDIISYNYNFISTDDGSSGQKGSICDYLEKIIKDFKPEKIVACAPFAVLKVVAQTAEKHKIQCEVAMEKVMACGIGVCRGCVISVKKDGKIQNATVCKDGPIFNAQEVIW
jgi:dihydroorotate dehydrogenase electron transfer subunit